MGSIHYCRIKINTLALFYATFASSDLLVLSATQLDLLAVQPLLNDEADKWRYDCLNFGKSEDS